MPFYIEGFKVLQLNGLGTVSAHCFSEVKSFEQNCFSYNSDVDYLISFIDDFFRKILKACNNSLPRRLHFN